MMNPLKFKELTLIQADFCVSMYTPTTNEISLDLIQHQYKSRLGEALVGLIEQGMTKLGAHHFLNQGFELLKDEKLWMQLADGLAVFISPNRFEYFTEKITFNPEVHIGQYFHLQPISLISKTIAKMSRVTQISQDVQTQDNHLVQDTDQVQDWMLNICY